jgi:hypothetical protein
MRHLCSLISFLSFAVLSGCGGDSLGRHAISGTVSLNGAPVERGSISFMPMDQGVTSSGAAFTDGSYSIPEQDGLPVGKYRVTINAPKPGTGKAAAEGAMPGDPLPPAEELIPPEWNVKSNETIEVKEGGPFEFNFDIKTKK